MLLVTSEGETLDSFVSDAFGHAPFFLLVDQETLDYHVIVNEFMDSPEGAGMAVANAIVSLGSVDAVLTGGIGGHGIKILKDAGIRVSPDEEGTVEQCVEDYKRRRAHIEKYGGERPVAAGPPCTRAGNPPRPWIRRLWGARLPRGRPSPCASRSGRPEMRGRPNMTS